MKTLTVKFYKGIIAVSIAIVFLTSSLGFKLLDPQSNNVFIRTMAPFLDEIGIDAVQDWRSNVTLEGRPTLAPIANYKVSVLGKETEWTKAFGSLYANGILALNTKTSIAESEFVSKWENTPIEKRVFISFTKDDLQHAELIKKKLEENGYKVFLYAESNREVFTSPKMIVDCMKTAGEVLVLDTENSRNKVGVIAEALAFAKYTYKPEQKLIEENQLLREQIQKAISQSEFVLPESDEITEYSMKYFNLSKEDAIVKLKKDYNVVLETYNNDLLEKGKQEYSSYLLNSTNLTPYAYNKMLTENLTFLTENRTINLLTKGARLLSFFGFCPYYKIPIVLCPICSPILK